jgi:hypothetical protein
MTSETDDNRSDAEEEEDEPVPAVVVPTEKGLGLGPSLAFVRVSSAIRPSPHTPFRTMIYEY